MKAEGTPAAILPAPVGSIASGNFAETLRHMLSRRVLNLLSELPVESGPQSNSVPLVPELRESTPSTVARSAPVFAAPAASAPLSHAVELRLEHGERLMLCEVPGGIAIWSTGSGALAGSLAGIAAALQRRGIRASVRVARRRKLS